MLTTNVIKRSICIIQTCVKSVNVNFVSPASSWHEQPLQPLHFQSHMTCWSKAVHNINAIPVACHIDTPDVMLMLLAVVKSEQPNSCCHCQCQNLHPIISILRLLFLQNFPSFASDALTKVTLSIFKCCLFISGFELTWFAMYHVTSVSHYVSVTKSRQQE